MRGALILCGVFFAFCGALPFPALPEQFQVDVNMTKKRSGEYLGLESIAFDMVRGMNHIQVSGPG